MKHSRLIRRCFLPWRCVAFPEPGWITCLGGGPLASGPPAPDRLPRPIYPPGLRISRAEGVGEVQTPMQYPMSYTPEIGQPVVFRPPKSGELGARFTEYLMVENGVVTSVEQTYRMNGGLVSLGLDQSR